MMKRNYLTELVLLGLLLISNREALAQAIGDGCADVGDCGAIPNIECRVDGGGSLCLCALGFADDGSGTNCAVDCGARPDPANGVVTILAGNGATEGSAIRFDCDTGYTASSPNIISCAGGTWSNADPTCTIDDCGNVVGFTDGTIDYTSGTTYQSVASFTCNNGYTMTTDNTRTCLAGGTWSNANAVCDPVDCGALTITDGTTAYTTGTTFGSVASFTCNPGYIISSAATRTCIAGGTWSGTGANPVCNPVDCGVLGDPPSGTADSSGGTEYQSEATFTCNTGYNMTGTATSTCQANSNWDNLDPLCEINDCGDVETFVNGNVVYAGGLKTYMSEATFSCNTGYTLSASVTRICQASSMWSLANPTCDINDCGVLGDPPGGTADTSGGTEYQSVATFTCYTGYTMTGTATSTCQANSNWDNLDPLCKINDCGVLRDPPGGIADTSGGTEYQSVATFTCNTGYTMTGTATSTCQANSNWDNLDPLCEINDCNDPPTPAGGSVDFPGGTKYLSEATYSCDTGYTMNGSPSSICQANSSWSNMDPLCQINDCGMLVNPVNGAVDTASGTTYGQTATYTCDTGYGIQGDSSRTCGADGLWTGNNPTCVIGDCGTLTNPTDGAVAVGQTTFGAKANYSCNAGYDIDGVESRTCQADSFWSDTAPICQLKDCGSPPYLQNGESSVSATTYGAEAIYSCSDGYGLVGSAAVQCLETGSWDTLPVCSTECGPPVAIENGQSSGLTGLLVGDTVTYSCDAGYELTLSEPTITCQIFGTWETAPGCRIIPIIYGETCSITEQCSTLRATCRSDGLGATRCLCATTGEIYDSAVDTCLADCGVLSNPTNGMVTNPDVTSESQTAEYSCNVGFALNDINLQRRTCLATGEWSGDAPLCVVGCPEAVPPKNGNVDATQGTATGDTVFYSCNDGYRLVGASSSVCLQDTTWSENDPVCLIECPVLPAVEFSHVDLSSGNWENSVATYICKKDYALVGVATRTCQSTGLWNGKEPDCIFATFPDVLLVVGSLLLFLVIVDIFAIIFCVYIRYFKKDGNPRPQDSEFDYIPDSTDDDKEKYERFDRYQDYDEKPLDKMENGIPPATMIHAGPGRASFKKSRNAKVAPEDANKKNAQNALNAQNAPRKPPVPRFDKANSKGIPKPKPLPKGTYKNTTGYGPKVYGPEPIRFRNETIPFVALETSHPPPSTQQPPVLDDFREEKVADVERLLRDEGFTSGSNGRGKSTADEDQISIDHLTNPVFPESHERPILMDYDAHTGQKPNDSDDIFKGRLTVPPVPKGQEKSPQEITEGERFLSDEARKHLKVSMTAYSPVLGKDRPPKV